MTHRRRCRKFIYTDPISPRAPLKVIVLNFIEIDPEDTAPMTHMQSAVLWFAKRQLLGGDDEEEDPSACPSNRDDYSQADNIVGNATLHQVFTYTAAASTAIAVIVAGYMILSQ